MKILCENLADQIIDKIAELERQGLKPKILELSSEELDQINYEMRPLLQYFSDKRSGFVGKFAGLDVRVV